jgi:hypothetical protein
MNRFYLIQPSSAILLVKKQAFVPPGNAIGSPLPIPIPQRFRPLVELAGTARIQSESRIGA